MIQSSTQEKDESVARSEYSVSMQSQLFPVNMPINADKSEELNRTKDTLSIANSKKWWSIRLIYLTMFLSAISFTIVVTNIYPYLKTLNPNTSKSYYGWVVAVFSIGQFISAPLFGFWSQFRPAREPIAFALLLSSLFNILYAYCNIFPSSIAIYIVLVSRFFIGSSIGHTSVMRAFISTATTEKERTSSLI